MKQITFGCEQKLRAIRASSIALFFAAGAGLAWAAPHPVTSAPFVQQDNLVTTPGASGTYSGATFLNGGNTFTVIISPASGQTATLNNTNEVVLVGNNSTITVSSGIAITDTGSLSNALEISGNGTVTNSGSITADGGGTGGEAIDITGSGTVINSGSISGAGTSGINLGGDNSSLFTDGGTISGGTYSINLGGDTSSVTIVGRTDMVGVIQGNNNTGNVLNLDLVGMTPAQAAALNALSGHSSGDITLGTYTYDWAGFASSNISAVSLEQVVDPGLVAAATAIDNHSLPLGFDSFYVAASGNPEAALNALVGREINQGVDTLGINLNTTLTSDLNEHLDNLLTGGQIGGIDVGGLHLGEVGSMYAFSDTGSQLDSLLHMTGSSVFGGTTMSTDVKEVVAVNPEKPRWGVWAAGNVTFGNESGGNTLSGFHSTLGSPTLGFDCRIAPNLVVGVLGSYTTVKADFDDGSQIDSTTELGALYGTWRDGNWYVNGIAGAGATQFNNQRTTFGSLANSSPNGDDFVTDWTGGYDFHLGDRWNITPELGLQYTHLDINSFTETGAGIFDLSEGDQGIDSLRSHVGFNLNKAYSLGPDLTFIPELRALWYHEFMDNSHGVSTSLPGAPALGSFDVSTFSPQRDFALVGVGLDTAFTGYKGMSVGLFINYNAQVGQSDYIANSVNAGIRVDF